MVTLPGPAARSDEAPTSGSEGAIREVGQCRVLAELGHGGMANVYLAVTQSQGGVSKLVVLKALRPEQAAEPEALAMFLDEARIAAQLNHPNVVQTYEVGRHGDRYVMVMEYLEGQSLSRILREAQEREMPLPLAMGLRIISAALDGLHYAHELASYTGTPLGLVHRDISPQNIFVTYEGQVKILDFGIAKAASSSTQTAAGIIKGKFAYMAPEHMTGHVLDRRADIFSMGCVLWALAAGEKLWHGVPDVQLMRRVLKSEIPSPRSVNPSCDEELERIVARCLAHDPAERYATALELQADLDAYAERLGKNVKLKAIGKLVSELFAEHRSQVREVVELQLSTTNPAEPGLPTIHDGDSSASSGRLDGHSLATQIERRRRRWPFFAVAVALTAGALLIPRQRSTAALPKQPSPAAAPANVGQKSTALAAEPPTPATIRFDVRPQGAALFLDGTLLPENTSELALPRDGAAHVLRAEAEGYESQTLAFTVNGDASLSLSLVEAPKSALKPRTRARGSRRSGSPAPTALRATPAAAKPAAADCDNPFFIDAAGIKRVRPECR